MTVHYQGHGVTVHAGDCLDVLAEMGDATVDSVCTDPPYNLNFMAKPWDAYDGQEDAGFAYWLSGLIDGEGHFAVKQHARGTHAPYFQLKMRADERMTLERICRTVGAGSVNIQRHEPNPMAQWIIQDRAGCQRLVDLLDKYPLRAKKEIDYWAWREAVCEWTSRPRGNRWHGRTDNTRMGQIRDRLMQTRAYTSVPWSGNEFQDWCRLWAAECLRVLKPGGHLLAFGGTRTSHRLASAIEDAGFEIRDSIVWLYGSGFPKSLDVGKAIDKAAGAEREVVGPGRWNGVKGTAGRDGGITPDGYVSHGGTQHDLTTPATDAARTWQGWGTALKPAHEPIVVARKPLAGTVAGNVLAHGTGALNIDGCRVGEAGGTTGAFDGSRSSGVFAANDGRIGGTPAGGVQNIAAGRWPANVVLSHADDCGDTVCAGGCPVATLDKQSGELTSGANPSRRGADGERSTYGEYAGQSDANPQRGAETGSASRFFPAFRYEAKAPTTERIRLNGSAHATVKPLDLMRWLVRLVTPPGGVVLDPFAGSGTTAEAALLEGFRCITIEREPDYLPLIVQRINRRRDPVAATRAAPDGPSLFDLLEGA